MLVLVLLGLFVVGGQMLFNGIFNTPGASHISIVVFCIVIGFWALYQISKYTQNNEVLTNYYVDYFLVQIPYFVIACIFVFILVQKRQINSFMVIALILFDVCVFIASLKQTHSIKTAFMYVINFSITAFAVPIKLFTI